MTILEVLDQRTVDDWGKQQAQELDLTKFDLSLTSDGDIYLEYITVARAKQGQGTGSKAMQRLCDFADHWHKRILLTPSERNTATGTTSRSRLIDFYKRFGFKLNQGRNRDWSTRALMIREPQKIKKQ